MVAGGDSSFSDHVLGFRVEGFEKRASAWFRKCETNESVSSLIARGGKAKEARYRFSRHFFGLTIRLLLVYIFFLSFFFLLFYFPMRKLSENMWELIFSTLNQSESHFSVPTTLSAIPPSSSCISYPWKPALRIGLIHRYQKKRKEKE